MDTAFIFGTCLAAIIRELVIDRQRILDRSIDQELGGPMPPSTLRDRPCRWTWRTLPPICSAALLPRRPPDATPNRMICVQPRAWPNGRSTSGSADVGKFSNVLTRCLPGEQNSRRSGAQKGPCAAERIAGGGMRHIGVPTRWRGLTSIAAMVLGAALVGQVGPDRKSVV